MKVNKIYLHQGDFEECQKAFVKPTSDLDKIPSKTSLIKSSNEFSKDSISSIKQRPKTSQDDAGHKRRAKMNNRRL